MKTSVFRDAFGALAFAEHAFDLPPVAVVRRGFDARQAAEDEVDVPVLERPLAETFAEGVHRENDGVLFLLRSGCDGAPAGRGASGEQECKQYTGVSFHFGVFLFA